MIVNVTEHVNWHALGITDYADDSEPANFRLIKPHAGTMVQHWASALGDIGTRSFDIAEPTLAINRASCFVMTPRRRFQMQSRGLFPIVRRP